MINIFIVHIEDVDDIVSGIENHKVSSFLISDGSGHQFFLLVGDFDDGEGLRITLFVDDSAKFRFGDIGDFHGSKKDIYK